MDFLKEHKFSVIFVVIVLVLIVLFARRSVFTTTPQVPKNSDVALDQIKDLIINKKDCATAIPELQALVAQSPNFVEAIHWLGVCQFQTGQNDAAKATFEKVLTMDSSDLGAQGYLKTLNSGASVTIDTGAAPMTEGQLETAFGITLDASKFTFVRLAVVPLSSGGQALSGFYKTTLSAAAAKDYFTSALEKAGHIANTYSVTTENSGGSVYVSVTLTKPK